MPGRQRILLTWELGEGLGHIRPLTYLAQQLDPARFELVFACRDAVLAAHHVHRTLGPVLPAPYQKRPLAPTDGARSYAYLLQRQGYLDEAELIALLRAWHDLIALVQPDLIIADHSPSAILAAGDVPVVQIGSGHTIPPAHANRFPDVETGEEALAPVIDPGLLRMVNRARSHFGGAAFSRLPQFLETAGRCMFTLPELDPYRGQRREAVLGPLEPVPPLKLYPADYRIFAYISGEYERFDALIRQLAAPGFDVTIFMRNASAAQSALAESRGLSVCREAPPLAEILPAMSLVLHHGGLATAQAALFAGRPQIILPQHGEGRLTGARLSDMGAAHVLEAETIHKLGELLPLYLRERGWRDEVMDTARNLRRSWEANDPVGAFLETVDKVLAGQTARA